MRSLRLNLLYVLHLLLKKLKHVVALLLLVDQFFVEHLVYGGDRLLDFCNHGLELTLELWHHIASHSFLELLLNHFLDLVTTHSLRGGADLDSSVVTWATLCCGGLKHLIDLRQDRALELGVNNFYVFLHEGLNGLLDLLFNDLRQRGFHWLRDNLLNLDLEVLLGLDLLLERVHLHVKLLELFVQILILLHDGSFLLLASLLGLGRSLGCAFGR
jgi:hypothetical protein